LQSDGLAARHAMDAARASRSAAWIPRAWYRSNAIAMVDGANGVDTLIGVRAPEAAT
jgi:hypothetical protein